MDMSAQCPVPADWLSYLQGDLSAVSANHLDECLSCRQVVDKLKPIAAGSGQFGDWLKGVDLHQGRPWTETVPDAPVAGQIWLSTGSFAGDGFSYKDLDRLPILVLGVASEDAGDKWLDVVPLWTDTENATTTDLVLSRTETSLNSPLRALFHLQMTLALGQLSSCVGELTDSGELLLRNVVAGHADPLRFGDPIDADGDARLESSRWLEDIARVIGAYRQFIDERDDADPTVLPFTLIRSERQRNRALGLAAKTAANDTEILALAQSTTMSFSGYLLYRLFGDTLLLAVEAVHGITGPIQVLLRSKRLAEPWLSPPFTPQVGQQVLIAEGQAVMPREVDAMELHIRNG
jgi:hypothetical protein